MTQAFFRTEFRNRAAAHRPAILLAFGVTPQDAAADARPNRSTISPTPLAARPRTMAIPMPLLPPVTRATLPVNSVSIAIPAASPSVLYQLDPSARPGGLHQSDDWALSARDRRVQLAARCDAQIREVAVQVGR